MKNKQKISVFKIICKMSSAITILLAGIIFTAALPLFVTAAPGDLDPTFGGGKVLTQIGSSYDHGNAVAVQTDGKIVVAGVYYFNATEGERCVLVRYNAVRNTRYDLRHKRSGNAKLSELRQRGI